MGMLTVLRGGRGTSTIEFLVVLPILLLIMFASVELSRAWMTMNLATTAAREGARAGAVQTPTDGLNRINDILSAGGATCSPSCQVVCIPDPCAVDADGNASRVQASVNVVFQTAVPVFLPGLSSITIQQTASMRYEGSTP
jgi:Flp pilus assembly protein TadG